MYIISARTKGKLPEMENYSVKLGICHSWNHVRAPNWYCRAATHRPGQNEIKKKKLFFFKDNNTSGFT
jgi:hypothetical protein